MKKRVIIADEQTALRQMMARVITAEGGYEVVSETDNGRDALEHCVRLKPDILVLELALPQLCGKEVLRRLRRKVAAVRVLIFCGTLSQHSMVEIIKCRPNGLVEKRDTLRTFLEALRAVAEGRAYFSGIGATLWAEADADDSLRLTTRELDVLQLVAESCRTKEIASRLGLAPKTVENHRAHLMEKLHLHDIAALTRYAVKHGFISPGD